MTNVIIHGEFGEIYGTNHKFKVSKLLEITNALQANNPGVKNFLLSRFKEGLSYAFVDPKNPNKRWETVDELSSANAPEEIHIVPTITGAFVFTAILLLSDLIINLTCSASCSLRGIIL